jgi:caffeoyl-CoA O-methyltransferase
VTELPRTVSYADRLLPDGSAMNGYYEGDNFAAALYETICRSSGVLENDGLSIQESEIFPQSYMGSDPVSLAFLKMLIVISGARRVLEVGTFVGVSAMTFARSMPADGKVTTIEKFSQFSKIAQSNFEQSGLRSKIRLLNGDAFDVLPSLDAQEKFDLFFIDGNKERYLDYFLACERLASASSVFVIDDCLFRGDVLNAEPTTEKGRGVKAFLDYMAQRDDYHRLLVPMCTGLFIARKKTA